MFVFSFLALFLLREPDALVTLPDAVKKDYFDSEEQNMEKLKTLKLMITEKFPVS